MYWLLSEKFTKFLISLMALIDTQFCRKFCCI